MSQSTELNLASPAFKANPYPAFARLRAEDPINLFLSSNGQNTWLITRYADAELLLREDQRFVKDRHNVPLPEQPPHISDVPASPNDLMSMSIVDYDPPDHTRLRMLFNPFFIPRQMERWRVRA